MGEMAYETSKLSDIYFNWLYKMVESNGHFRALCNELFTIEFTFSVERDANRQADGRDLRVIFCNEYAIPIESLDMELSTHCSVFEMLLALARRINSDVMYQADKGDRTADWFFRMVKNMTNELGMMRGISDEYWGPRSKDYVDRVVSNWLDRQYDDRGIGSIFPLQKAQEGYQKTEIWYQMQAYLMENFPI